MITRTAFCAIRKNLDEGKEYIDITSVTLLPQEVQRKAKRDEEYLPNWAKANPFVRVAKVEITEMIP